MPRPRLDKKAFLFWYCIPILPIGCSNISTPPWPGSGHGDRIPSEDECRVVWSDKTLKDKDIIRISKVIPSRKENGKIEVYCELINRTRDDLGIQVQTAFKDDLGRIREETPWQTHYLSALAGKAITVTSMKTDMDSYLVRIRLAVPTTVYDDSDAWRDALSILGKIPSIINGLSR